MRTGGMVGLVVAPPDVEVVAENVVKPTEAVAEATTLVGRPLTLDAVAVLVVKEDAVTASVASEEVVAATATRR